VIALDKEKIKKEVKKTYGRIAASEDSCCCSCGCGSDNNAFAQAIGYAKEELDDLPGSANLGLSCGNPLDSIDFKETDTLLDLGSGAGFDCFIAASKIGPRGKIIGLDMTEEMIAKANHNLEETDFENIEFRLGSIEDMPVEDSTVDIVISNCVINLSTDKPKVLKEIFRVLKPKGRISIADISLKKELPEKIRKDIASYVSCVGGAILLDEYRKIVEETGFENIEIKVLGDSSHIYSNSMENTEKDLESVLSINITAVKPG
jgi:arsenite methyltransferase